MDQIYHLCNLNQIGGLTEQHFFGNFFAQDSHIFTENLNLKFLIGFDEDYTKNILNAKLELILVISHT